MLLKVLNTFKGINFAITWVQTVITVRLLIRTFQFFLVDFVLKDPREKEDDKKDEELPPHRVE